MTFAAEIPAARRHGAGQGRRRGRRRDAGGEEVDGAQGLGRPLRVWRVCCLAAWRAGLVGAAAGTMPCPTLAAGTAGQRGRAPAPLVERGARRAWRFRGSLAALLAPQRAAGADAEAAAAACLSSSPAALRGPPRDHTVVCRAAGHSRQAMERFVRGQLQTMVWFVMMHPFQKSWYGLYAACPQTITWFLCAGCRETIVWLYTVKRP